MVARASVILFALVLTACGAEGFVSPESVPSSLRVARKKIDATGATDVTNPLNALLASAPNGSTVLFPAGARYRCEGIVQLINKQNVTIEGNGALIFATTDGSGVAPPEGDQHLWPRTRSHFRVDGGSGIVVRNLNVQGANPNAGLGDDAYVSALEAQHGFHLVGVDGIELDNVTATDVYGDFVYLGTKGQNPWTQNAHVHDSRFERNGRQGIAVTAARDVVIENNFMDQMRRSIFDLEPHSVTGGALNIVIRNNEVGRSRLLFLASGGKGSNVSFALENNVSHDQMQIFVKDGNGARRGPIRVVGNVSDRILGAPNPVMRFWRIDGLVVRDNVQPTNENREMTGVWTCESTGVDIGGNSFIDAAQEFEILEVCP